ncbi:hypothetical protein [Psychroserpens sp.]
MNFSTTSNSEKTLGDFENVKITFNGKRQIASGRYNAISNEIEIKNDDGEIYNLRKFTDLSVSFISSKKNYKTVLYVNKDGLEIVDFFELTNKQNQVLLLQTNFDKWRKILWPLLMSKLLKKSLMLITARTFYFNYLIVDINHS